MTRRQIWAMTFKLGACSLILSILVDIWQVFGPKIHGGSNDIYDRLYGTSFTFVVLGAICWFVTSIHNHGSDPCLCEKKPTNDK